ncbi:TrmH family RNA methyltransferase [Micrococcoides hystricis]|uniref:TrmH family RNA methyltransferase n=1 Tax=Micrococcoides hystricis TaxID=1572761 RepID=A0ABV6PAB9_9MICC
MTSYAERPTVEMTNPRADRVKSVARLSGRSARLKTGKFRVEGPQAVREALRSGLEGKHNVGAVQELYYQPETLQRHPDIAELVDNLDPADVFVRSCTAEVIAAMSDAQTPQGLVAVCTLVGRTEDNEPTGRYVALLCGLQDPGNVGTIIRAADAAGATATILSSGSVDVHNPKVVRSTVGSLFHLPIYQNQDVSAVVQAYRSAGWQIFAADGYGDVDLDQLQNEALQNGSRQPASQEPDLRKNTIWLFGNEAKGLSEAELELADARVAVPLYGQAESLNVATAATLCLYASARAHRSKAETSSSDATKND